MADTPWTRATPTSGGHYRVRPADAQEHGGYRHVLVEIRAGDAHVTSIDGVPGPPARLCSSFSDVEWRGPLPA